MVMLLKAVVPVVMVIMSDRCRQVATVNCLLQVYTVRISKIILFIFYYELFIHILSPAGLSLPADLEHSQPPHRDNHRQHREVCAELS